MIELVVAALVDAPRAVRQPLERELTERCPARRGAYPVIHEIDDDARIVSVS